ncbi:MAG TPA: nucleoside deaminase [Puia sp.]|nr:nucleoside deaminase [Puia sp.]
MNKNTVSLYEKWMHEASMLAKAGMDKNEGGPFGAVIILNNEIVGRGWNQVLTTKDPTAHAEIVAIRDASKHLQRFHLAACELYTTCEPCPMCLSAIYWARIPTIYYSNSREDAKAIGFNDAFIYDELGLSLDKRSVKMILVIDAEAGKLFSEWKLKGDKRLY